MEEIEFDQGKILIIGDLVLDEYILGNSTSLSYEAPVPVIKREITEYQLGGIGNVANNIITLGGKCDLISIIGNDSLKSLIESNLEEIGLDKEFILNIEGYSNNLSTRIISGGKHVARVDNPITPLRYKEDFINFINNKLDNIEEYSMLLIQDSGRFFIDESILKILIDKAIEKNIKIIFDISNYIKSDYKLNSLASVDLIRTNLNYIKSFGGIPTEIDLTKEELEAISFEFLRISGANSLVVTLGRGGLIYLEKDKSKIIEGFTVYVYDVSGAGDSLLATICLGISSGIDIDTVLQLANISGHIACRYIGATPVELGELLEAYKLLTQNLIPK